MKKLNDILQKYGLQEKFASLRKTIKYFFEEEYKARREMSKLSFEEKIKSLIALQEIARHWCGKEVVIVWHLS